MVAEIELFASEWGVNSDLLLLSVKDYSMTKSEIVPYISDLIKNVDFNRANNQLAGNPLRHNMNLTAYLPKWIFELSKKFKK